MTHSPAPRLFVATPCYGGMVTQVYMQSVLALALDGAANGLAVSLGLLGQDALITRSRNTLVARFRESDATHLLFIDADIGFSTADVVRLLQARREVIGGLYPIRAHRFGSQTPARIRKGEAIETAGLDYVGEPTGAPDAEGVAPARFAGTGFLMIEREAIERMIACHPETRCRHVHVAGEDALETHALFDCLIDPATRDYLSEDYAFCARWRRIGGKIWLHTGCRLSHNGMSEFHGMPETRFMAMSQ